MATSNDMKRIARESSKLAGSNPAYSGDPRLAAQSLIRTCYTIQLASAFANGANVVAPNANPSQVRAMCNGRVLAAHATPAGTATAAATNFANILAVVSPANGAAGTTVASANTNTSANGGTGNLAAGAPVALTVTDLANARYVKGQVLSGTVTMAGSGVATPAMTITIQVEEEGPCDDVGI